MATMIGVWSNGKCVGRCDARCYSATMPECDCVCGGKNHGVGKAQASENTKQMLDSQLEDLAKSKGITMPRIGRFSEQLEMFG